MLTPQKLALTSPTSGCLSVGIVRSRTQATELSFSFVAVLEVSIFVGAEAPCLVVDQRGQ
jgi:hypothetical protein